MSHLCHTSWKKNGHMFSKKKKSAYPVNIWHVHSILKSTTKLQEILLKTVSVVHLILAMFKWGTSQKKIHVLKAGLYSYDWLIFCCFSSRSRFHLYRESWCPMKGRPYCLSAHYLKFETVNQKSLLSPTDWVTTIAWSSHFQKFYQRLQFACGQSYVRAPSAYGL